jgi:hypothetical protein
MKANTAESVKKILFKLGKTCDEVYAELKRAGCRGDPLTQGWQHPLIRYIYRKFDDGRVELSMSESTNLTRVSRSENGVLLLPIDAIRLDSIDGESQYIPLPEPVQDFFCKFRLGQYAHLVLRKRVRAS